MTPERIDMPARFRDPLLQLYLARAVKRGDFTLASGQKSAFYIDSKLVFLNSQACRLIGRAAFSGCRHFQPDAIGGLEVGAIAPTAAAVACFADMGYPSVEGFFVRKAPKDHGNPKLVEGLVKAGDRVVVLEDVLTTGQSAFKAVQAVQALGAEVVLVLALVDRSSESKMFVPELDSVPRRFVFDLSDFAAPTREPACP